MEKRGSRYLRYALFNATKFVCQWDPTFSAYLAKKRAEGKHYNVAISHAAKKLVRVIYQLEKSGQTYIKLAWFILIPDLLLSTCKDALFVMQFSMFNCIWNAFLQSIQKILFFTWLLIVSLSFTLFIFILTPLHFLSILIIHQW